MTMVIVTEDNWDKVIFGPLPKNATQQESPLQVVEEGVELTPDEQASYEMWLLKQYGQEIEEDF